MDVCISDTTGEMVRLLQTADLVFVGRSLAPNEGGQTPVEAAALGRAVLFGPHMTNFRLIARHLVDAGAAIVVGDPVDLSNECLRLIRSPDARALLAEAGVRWHQANHGAVDRTMSAIEAALSELPAASRSA